MEKTSELFDNLYYADQIGSIEEQTEWLDKLRISNPVLVSFESSGRQQLEFLGHPYPDKPILSRYIILRPSMYEYPRTFDGFHALDAENYLLERFSPSIHYLTFKPKELCVDEFTEAVADTAAAEDAASACPTEALECGK